MISEDIKDCDEYTKGFCDGCDTMKKHFDKLCDTLRTTKRALWLARAERASRERLCLAFCFNGIEDEDKLHEAHRQYGCWCWTERKCRAKAEEYR